MKHKIRTAGLPPLFAQFSPVFILVLFIVLFSGCQKKAPPELDARPLKAAAAGVGTTGAKEAENFFIKVSSEANPAVVNIRTTQKVQESDSSIGQMPRDRYHGYDEDGDKKPHTESSLGSGVLISPDGYIVTNAHVVEDATEIKIKLINDKQDYNAKLIGTDSKTDLAVLKIDAKNPLPIVKLGDSSKIQTGQWAIAIGNPFGLEHTVTVGVVSGVGRADVGVAQYENFIQTDASVNPGNSGGPLLNSNGEVIGINTAIMSTGQGISFAIPVNMVKEVAKALIEQGKVVRGWLGVGIQTLTPELAEGFKMPGRTGVLVNKIYEGSPAERARFASGDVITVFDGMAINEARQLQGIVAGTRVGKVVDVKVFRDRIEKTIKVRIDEMGDVEKLAGAKPQEEVSSAEAIGLTVHRTELAAAGQKGVIVVEVAGGSAAEKAGIMPGDIIASIGKDRVESLADFKKAAGRLKGGEMAVFLIYRAKSPTYLAFKVDTVR